MEKGAIIETVRPGSPAAEMGLEAGDAILSINGRRPRDLIDYHYLTSGEEEIVLEIRKTGGERWTIEAEIDEDLGLEFADPLFDGLRRCRNRCVFCFVDQMPPGFRKTLYLKDDDYRLSFLHGNFITLNDMREEEFDRIRAQRLSPLYVSVHATDDEVRSRMMGRPVSPILPKLKRLAEGGVGFHFQIVLCPGLNDGDVLEETLGDLCALGEAAESVVVVPVGLTDHRRGLPELRPVGPAEAGEAIGIIEAARRANLKTSGRGIVQAADELFLTAGMPIPEAGYYEGYPQYENGAGIARDFIDEFRAVERSGGGGGAYDVAVGVLAAPLIEELLEGSEARVIPVPNRTFGERITVTGLLTGRDIAAGLKAGGASREVLLPAVTVRQGGTFLDGLTPADLKRETGTPVRVVDGGGELARIIRGVRQ